MDGCTIRHRSQTALSARCAGTAECTIKTTPLKLVPFIAVEDAAYTTYLSFL